MLIAVIALFIVSIAFICLERSGRIKLPPFAAGVIYLLLPMIFAVLLSIDLLNGYNEIFIAENFSDELAEESLWKLIKSIVNWKYLASLIAETVLGVIAAVVCLICVIVLSKHCIDKQTALPRIAALAGNLSAAAATVFVCFTALAAIHIALPGLLGISVVYLIFSVVFLFVFLFSGFALLGLALLGYPLLLLEIGVLTLVECLPMIMTSYVWICCFIALNIVSVVISARLFIRLKKEGIFTTANAVVCGIFSVLPLVNVFILAYADSKIKKHSKI